MVFFLLPWRRRVEFSSPAYAIGLERQGDVLDLCVDVGLMRVLEEPFRRILLVYPSDLCRDRADGPVVGDRIPVDRVLPMLREGCRRAWEVVEELRGKARPNPVSLALLGKPSREEYMYAEAKSAAMLCEHVLGEGFKARVKWYQPGYVVYSSRGQERERIKKLVKLDEGVRGFLDSFSSRR